ncbi:hypothetical protein [Microcystis aeruginosa]|uniref:hypothetical protein n=1 Tax=Microcystis aeruginosa TaxID=1126 RepID=UPI0008FF858A|nr:hypothetical protein [Microcystis aeruginosa]MDB9432138.1 hypothetical protein [Microcystis aeruginosa CS-552/01]
MEAIDLCVLCVLCVFVVRSTPSLGGMYLRIHFTHQIQESQKVSIRLLSKGFIPNPFLIV